MHSMLFSSTINDTHAKTGQNQLKLVWKSTISAVRAQYQLFEHNINIKWFACDMPSTNKSTGSMRSNKMGYFTHEYRKFSTKSFMYAVGDFKEIYNI